MNYPSSKETRDTLSISVVVPHLNQPNALVRCLASLVVGSRLPDEILVVDNGSDDLPDLTDKDCSSIKTLQEKTPGPGPARNLGVANAKGDTLAFIDADCLADPEWLAAAEVALSNPDAQILGGDVRIAYKDPNHLTALEAYESIYAYRMDRYISREGFTGTGNLVVRRKPLEDVGPFAGLSVAEDRDWGQRATGMGYKINYVPEMKVYHPAREKFSELKLKWARHVAHDFVAASARPGGRLRFLVKTVAMGVSPLAEIPRIMASDRVPDARARGLAFIILTRIRFYRARVMIWLLVGGDPDRLSGGWNRG